MRIALYYPWIYLTSGAERVLAQLTGRSRHAWTLFTNRFQPESTFPELRDRDVVELERISVERSLGTTFKSAMTISRQRLPLDGFDALVVVCEGLGDLVTFRNRDLPLINICLTPLRIVCDLSYREHYLSQKGMLHRLAIAAGAPLYGFINQRAWRHYDRVFFISEESRRRAINGGLIQNQAGEVVHVGLGFEPPAPSAIFEPFFLIPGRIMWTKNIELGIRAFKLLVAQHPELAHFRLVVAGIVDEKSEPYLKKLQDIAGDDTRIEFRIFPSDAELEALYRRAWTVLFTPFNEDWGIVPIEAMAFGKPVIAVNRGGPRESVGDGVHGFLEEPEPERFATRMAQLASNPELAWEMGSRGHVRAQKFSWNAFAAKIDDAIDALCRSRESMVCEEATGP